MLSGEGAAAGMTGRALSGPAANAALAAVSFGEAILFYDSHRRNAKSQRL
jgi:hypothetical protein